jgi:hypothetical protein
MSITAWIVLGIAVISVIGYLLVMRVFFRQSRAADKEIDYSKIRPVKDDDD